MKPRAIDFVSYGVSSLEKAVPFYRDVLGLTPYGEPYQNAAQEFDVGNVTLAVNAPPFGSPPSPGAKGGATVAISVDDMAATLEELKQKGVKVLWGPEESPVCFLAGIADPDGNEITLHHRKDGTAG